MTLNWLPAHFPPPWSWQVFRVCVCVDVCVKCWVSDRWLHWVVWASLSSATWIWPAAFPLWDDGCGDSEPTWRTRVSKATLQTQLTATNCWTWCNSYFWKYSVVQIISTGCTALFLIHFIFILISYPVYWNLYRGEENIANFLFKRERAKIL